MRRSDKKPAVETLPIVIRTYYNSCGLVGCIDRADEYYYSYGGESRRILDMQRSDENQAVTTLMIRNIPNCLW